MLEKEACLRCYDLDLIARMTEVSSRLLEEWNGTEDPLLRKHLSQLSTTISAACGEMLFSIESLPLAAGSYLVASKSAERSGKLAHAKVLLKCHQEILELINPSSN